jgi:hypothetical protein
MHNFTSNIGLNFESTSKIGFSIDFGVNDKPGAYGSISCRG